MGIKKIINTIIFVIVNPHLIPCIIFAVILLSAYKLLYFIADKIERAAWKMDKFDKYLAKKSVPTWMDSLVDGEKK